MEKLITLFQSNKAYLVKRVLEYAKLHGYVKYTSTLEEAWVISISGLSAALIRCIKDNSNVPRLMSIRISAMNRSLSSDEHKPGNTGSAASRSRCFSG